MATIGMNIRLRLGITGVLRQFNRHARDARLGNFAALGKPVNYMTVFIARRKIHAAIHIAPILQQNLFDDTHRLHKHAPIVSAQKTQTADTVANGNLINRLLLIFRLHHLLNGHAFFGQTLFNPGQRQGQCGAMALQTAY